jgi:hypothetical protein
VRKGEGVNYMTIDAQDKAVRTEYERVKAELPPCPKPIKTESGCKVAWYTYATRQEAEIACLHARLQAEYYSYLGYDFGWQSPGYDITEVADGFTVVWP